MTSQVDFRMTLFSQWAGPRVETPDWLIQHGLLKYKPIVSMVYASAPIWQQAIADGIPNIAPIIAIFNKTPQEIRAIVGGAHWKLIHHGTLKSNVDRLVLRMVFGWSLDEAMLFPAKERTRAISYRRFTKSSLLIACRLAEKPREFKEFLQLASDVQRMNVIIDPLWGRKRLRREHDAAAMRFVMRNADPTPWAAPWFYDIGDYSFSLLKSAAELALEGIQQRHCSGSYVAACKDGREFVMRIEGPERGTCSWRKGSSDMQVKCFANKEPNAETRIAALQARAVYLQHLRDIAKQSK